VGDAHGTNSGCGIVQNSNVPTLADPYSGLASNIPSNTCSSYPQEPPKRKDPALPASNQWSGSYTLSGGMVYLSGAVNKSGTGASCFGMMVGTLTINGTSNIFKDPGDTAQCKAAGLTLPHHRGTLVN